MDTDISRSLIKLTLEFAVRRATIFSNYQIDDLEARGAFGVAENLTKLLDDEKFVEYLLEQVMEKERE